MLFYRLPTGQAGGKKEFLRRRPCTTVLHGTKQILYLSPR